MGDVATSGDISSGSSTVGGLSAGGVVGEGDSVEKVSEREESEEETSESLRRLCFLLSCDLLILRRLPEEGISMGDAGCFGVHSELRLSSSPNFLELSKDTLEDITSERR
jgi:hypothetical protein